VKIWLLAAILLLVVTVLPFLVSLLVEVLAKRRRQVPRGFEVKLNAGEAPAALTKELGDLPARRID